MKKIIIYICILLPLISCKKSDEEKIIGKWSNKMVTETKAPFDIDPLERVEKKTSKMFYNFYEDGKCIIEHEMEILTPIVANGDWEYDPDYKEIWIDKKGLNAKFKVIKITNSYMKLKNVRNRRIFEFYKE